MITVKILLGIAAIAICSLAGLLWGVVTINYPKNAPHGRKTCLFMTLLMWGLVAINIYIMLDKVVP